MGWMSFFRGASVALPLLIACACHRAPTPGDPPTHDAAPPPSTDPPTDPPPRPVAQIRAQHTREEFCRSWPAGVPCTYAGLRDELTRRVTPESGLAGEAGSCGAARYLAFGAPAGEGTVAYFDARGELLSAATWLTSTGPYNAWFGTPETCVHADATSLSGAFPAGQSSFFPRFRTPAER